MIKIKLFTVLVLSLILSSCSSNKKVTEKRCASIVKNDFQNIIEEKSETIINQDTLFFTEVKFECVKNSFYTKKVMYDKFGKWDQEIYLKENSHPILLWNNLKLFPEDSTKFSVLANGLESSKTIYASILVFDKQNRDLLTEDNKYKTKLITYFSEMIRNNNAKKRGFYDIYWKTVDPERWERNKQYLKYR